MIGKKVIVRFKNAGVFFGTLSKIKKNSVIMTNIRKLYYWSGAASVEQLANEGVKNPSECKFTVINQIQEIYNPIQIIPCTKEAISIIESIKEWRND